jgi:hypothetical protein
LLESRPSDKSERATESIATKIVELARRGADLRNDALRFFEASAAGGTPSGSGP